MASLDAFTYCGLLQSKNIRLLEVIPASELGTLAVRLIEKNLDNAEFEALSYVWGSQAEKLPIKCNDCWLSIGSNLHDALCERRRRGSTALLWADAICINQDSNQEKTCQVRLMRDIFAKADRVIVWIGKERPDDYAAFQLAKKLYNNCNGDRYDIDAGIYDFEDFDCKSKGVYKSTRHPTWIALFE